MKQNLAVVAAASAIALGSIPIRRRREDEPPPQSIEELQLMGRLREAEGRSLQEITAQVIHSTQDYTCTNDFGYPARRFNAPGIITNDWPAKQREARRISKAMRKGRR